MTDIKGSISSSHLDDTKMEHASKRPRSYRRALVVGAYPGNIGAAIAERLEEQHDFTVSQYDIKDGFDFTVPHTAMNAIMDADADTLILANGRTHLDWIEDQPYSEITKVLDDTLLASIVAVREFVTATIEHEHSKHIVFIGSMAHNSVLNASAPYCAAKAGLHHFAQCAAWELTPKGYTVHIVHPSNVEGTPMTEATIEGLARYRGLTRQSAESYWGALNLMDRWLSPHDVAETVGWLVTSGAARYLSGSALELKAGQR